MNLFDTRTALLLLALTGAAGAAQADAVASKQTDLGALSTSSLSFGNSFVVSAGRVSSNGGSSFAQADTFYDTYSFTVPDAGYSSFTASLDLGSFFAISGLQSRLYTGGPVAAGSAPGAGGGTLLQAWSTGQSNPSSTVASGIGPFNMIQVGALQAGTYTLEVRGQVTGSNGGSYAGVINVAAIPEPGTYLMLVLGLGLIAAKIRRPQR